MDIHKPKPWHGWREFLKEYAIIVLGVATALAAEQAVEWFHWQGEVAVARVAIRAEITDAAKSFYARRIAISSCLDKKLDIVGTAIAEVAASRQPDLHGIVFNTLGSPIYDGEWQSERSSQVLTHFPREELALMSKFYGEMSNTRDFQLNESIAWGHLSALQEAGQKLGPADLAQLRANYHLARRFKFLISGNAIGQMEVAGRLGINPTPFTPTQIAESCNRVSDGAKF